VLSEDRLRVVQIREDGSERLPSPARYRPQAVAQMRPHRVRAILLVAMSTPPPRQARPCVARRNLALPLRALAAALLAAAGCYSAPHRPDGHEGLLPVGIEAPDVEGMDVTGKTTRLSSLRGRAVVVYFYPKDDTPGCTKEACAFRDAWDRFEQAHLFVIGVSAQSRGSHIEFQKKYGLPFPLVADEDGSVQRAYGVSRGLFGYARVTFLVDGRGKIVKVWPNVDPSQHAGEVLDAASAAGAR
jgi:peroxiredoxin Q/BCP